MVIECTTEGATHCYTFAELVLIILYISQITSVVAYNEGFENIFSRLKVSKASYFTIVLSKIIFGVIVGIIQIIIVYFVSIFFLRINWMKILRRL